MKMKVYRVHHHMLKPDRPTVTNVEDIITTTNDTDKLNYIISEDNWESNISHLAFQKILQLAETG